MALRTIAQSPNSVTINEENLSLINVNKPALDIPIYWHKFIIINTYGLNRNIVLKMFFEHINPLDFIPLSYTKNAEGAFFFARMCRPVVEKFCNNTLTVPNSLDSTKPFKMSIVLKYSSTNVIKVNLTENLLLVLQKRFQSQVLFLNNFSEDPDLTEYFLLSQPKILAFVLNIAKNIKPVGIKLCNNDIKTLNAFEILPEDGLITSLDLRHNSIKDLDELRHLTKLPITELWLEGNPLCDLYDEYSYVQQVIKFCPKIEKLDGFLLRQNGVPSFRRNFLCNTSAYKIVDQFLENYFPTYDSKNFGNLQAFYQEDALFSMSAEFLWKQLSSINSQLKSYKLNSRNILHVFTERTKNLYYGSAEIMKLFARLPRSEHDPYSFTVDVPYFTSVCATIIVTGVFREFPNTNRILGFNRHFFLKCINGTYRIANEQMHIFNALTSQEMNAFKKTNVLQEAQSPTQENQMVNTFAIITNLTKEWAKMFLEECHYNLKHAILLFIDLYKGDKIPSRGFKNVD